MFYLAGLGVQGPVSRLCALTPGGEGGGSIKITLYDPCFRSTTLYKASRLLTACFTFRPGETSVEIYHDPGRKNVRVHPHSVIRGVTCHRRPFPGSIFADDNTLYVIFEGPPVYAVHLPIRVRRCMQFSPKFFLQFTLPPKTSAPHALRH